MKLEPELRVEFEAEAESSDLPASQILRELMRDFVQPRRDSLEYDKFLLSKVDMASIPAVKMLRLGLQPGVHN